MVGMGMILSSLKNITLPDIEYQVDAKIPTTLTAYGSYLFTSNMTILSNEIQGNNNKQLIAQGDYFDNIIVGSDKKFNITMYTRDTTTWMNGMALFSKYRVSTPSASAIQILTQENAYPVNSYIRVVINDGTNINTYNSGTLNPINIRYHMSVNFDMSQPINEAVKIFINGVDSTLTATNTINVDSIQNVNTNVILFGDYNAAGGINVDHSYVGKISTLILYKDIMTPEQIAYSRASCISRYG